VSQVLEILNKKHDYVFVEHVPSVDEVFCVLKEALNNISFLVDIYNVIDKKVWNFIFFQYALSGDHVIPLAAFYLLIKVHKDPISVRPIAANILTLSYNASRYVDFILKPLVKSIPSILCNSVDLIRHLALVQFPVDCVFFSADVVNLYPNIPIDEGVACVGEAIDTYNQNLPPGNEPIQKEFILVLLKWVLTNNFVEFDGQCWKQIYGTAMGTPCAVVYANIYLHVLEQRAMEIMRRTLFIGVWNMFLLYVRYIDDIFAVCENIEFGLEFVRIFNSLSKTIKLTVVYNEGEKKQEKIPFLDTLIWKGALFARKGLFDVCVYQKPMNAYLYIPVFSYHSQRTFSSFIVGEVRRYTLCCTNSVDLESVIVSFRARLIVRGYPIELIDVCLATQFVRQDILFPPNVTAAYTVTCKTKPPYACSMYPFNPPLIPKQPKGGSLKFMLDNSPRYLDSTLTDILRYEGMLAESEYSYLTVRRKSCMISKKSGEKIGKFLLRSRYKSPSVSVK
jgi:hypothetical protein